MLEVNGLTAGYQGLLAVEDVSFRVKPGTIVTVAGANGAGKSTLLKTICGMHAPRSGSVVLDGQQIDGMKPHLVASRGLAYVPETRMLFPGLSVRKNLRLGSYLYRGEPDRERNLDMVFKLFPRLGERLEQAAGTLSGGEQQMLAISRALMTRPRLLMLDEPSQGIMPKLVNEIFVAIQAIRDLGITILLVEQRLSESLSISTDAVILQTGRVVLAGPAAEMRDRPEIRAAYLGM
jgi:branched-chain amino acid transport system ATP-binding protein